MGIKEQVRLVRESLRDYPQVQIIAATKYMDNEQTQELIDAGICDFGENRTDEFLKKYEYFKDNKDIRWHYFGVVQNRKIKDLANRIVCLHSLERIATAIEFEKRLLTPLDCFVQVNISEEPNKQGIPANKVKTFVKQLENYKIRIIGLMCIAPLTFDEEVLRKSFTKMRGSRKKLRHWAFPRPCHELSMECRTITRSPSVRRQDRLGRIFLI